MANLKRSIVFIDANNLFGGWKDLCKARGHVQRDPQTGKEVITKKLAYNKLIEILTRNTDFIRGYFYDSAPLNIGAKKNSFFDMLRMQGITVVTKELKFKSSRCRTCNSTDTNIPHQKGVDVALVTDLMNLGFEDAYDLAIVVSGDNDFVDAVKSVKSKGKNIWVASFTRALGQDLMRAADKVIHLDPQFDLMCL